MAENHQRFSAYTMLPMFWTRTRKSSVMDHSQFRGEILKSRTRRLVQAHRMNSDKAVIIGDGVIGLCTAYYALKRGFAVTAIERKLAGGDNYSVGNVGRIVPSHFTPLAGEPSLELSFKSRQAANGRST